MNLDDIESFKLVNIPYGVKFSTKQLYAEYRTFKEHPIALELFKIDQQKIYHTLENESLICFDREGYRYDNHCVIKKEDFIKLLQLNQEHIKFKNSSLLIKLL